MVPNYLRETMDQTTGISAISAEAISYIRRVGRIRSTAQFEFLLEIFMGFPWCRFFFSFQIVPWMKTAWAEILSCMVGWQIISENSRTFFGDVVRFIRYSNDPAKLFRHFAKQFMFGCRERSRVSRRIFVHTREQYRACNNFGKRWNFLAGSELEKV